MLEETLLALAGTAGVAIVKEMATDGWKATRVAITRLMGRAGKKPAIIEAQLDEDADTLERAEDAEREQVREKLGPRWGSRLVEVLEDCPHDQRADLAKELQALVDTLDPAAASGSGGQSITGSLAGRDINQIGSVGGDFTTGSGRG